MKGKRRPTALIYDIAFSALTLFTGSMLVLKTVGIYREGIASGGQIFSAEVIRAALSSVLPLLICWLVLLLVGVVVYFYMPRTSTVQKPPIHMTEERLRRKVTEKSGASTALQKKKKVLYFASAAAVALLSVFPILYFCDRSHFPAESISKEVLNAALYALPFCVVMLALTFAYIIICEKLDLSLIRSYKEQIKNSSAVKSTEKAKEKSHKKRTLIIRVAIFCLAVCLIVMGILNGSASEVFTKATKICTECIGLG